MWCTNSESSGDDQVSRTNALVLSWVVCCAIYAVLYCVVWWCVVLYCIELCCTVMWCIVVCCAALCHAMLCCIDMLYCTVMSRTEMIVFFLCLRLVVSFFLPFPLLSSFYFVSSLFACTLPLPWSPGYFTSLFSCLLVFSVLSDRQLQPRRWKTRKKHRNLWWCTQIEVQ